MKTKNQKYILSNEKIEQFFQDTIERNIYFRIVVLIDRDQFNFIYENNIYEILIRVGLERHIIKKVLDSCLKNKFLVRLQKKNEITFNKNIRSYNDD